MKKILLFVLVIFTVLTFTACFSADQSGETSSEWNKESSSQSEAVSETSSKQDAQAKTVSYEIIENDNKTGTNAIGTFWMQGVVIVENTGTADLYLSSGSFDIEDANGHLVASESYITAYPQVIAPGEKAVYYADFSLNNGTDGETYTIVPHLEIEEAKVPVVRFAVSDVTLSEDEFGYLQMTGRVENTSDKEESLYPVVAILYDTNDKVLSVMFTYPDKLAAGEKRGFEMSDIGNFADVKLADVARYDIFAYPNQYQF